MAGRFTPNYEVSRISGLRRQDPVEASTSESGDQYTDGFAALTSSGIIDVSDMCLFAEIKRYGVPGEQCSHTCLLARD
jgi:hypothetical protein